MSNSIYFFTLFFQLLKDIWARKLRSFLALFGIVWGTYTVIMLLALGTGFSTASKKNMMRVVEGAFFVLPGQTIKSFHGLPKGRIINIKADAVMALKRTVPNILLASPMMRTKASINFEKSNTDIDGISEDYSKLRRMDLIQNSRFINKLDINNSNHVTILGNKLKNRIFGNVDDVIGKTVRINNIPFVVIGVMQKPSRRIYNWHDNAALIPYSTYVEIFGDKNIYFFMLLPNPNVNSKAVEQSMRSYLGYKYHFVADDNVAIKVFNTTKIYQFVRWFFVGLQIFFGICGALALAVGSLSVANIMFLIVVERTHEIGVRLAIGAADRYILLQIMLEALIIFGFGGIIGFILSYLTNLILHSIHLPLWLGIPVISGKVVIITITILTIFGLLAGYFPARRASKMDPVEVLGH